MEQLLIPVYFISSMYNGVYLEPDSSRYYLLDNKQTFIGAQAENELSYVRPTIKDNKILLRGYYEEQND